jgi:hypothetical protein
VRERQRVRAANFIKCVLTQISLREGGVWRPMRNVFLHFYIDTVCTVVFFMYMPVTLIASETERERQRARAANFIICLLTKKFLRGGGGIDAVCTVVLFMYMPVTLIASEAKRET